MLLFLAEFAGAAESICPRATLRRVIARAHNMGFDPYAALEYEFFMFNETPESVRAKGYKNLQPMTPGWFGYSMLRNSVRAEFYHQILELCESMDFPLEGLHTETGPGVLEAAIAVDSADNAGDKAALFKTFIKVLAQRHDMMATFMAKWSPDLPGSSGHLHQSLWDAGNQINLFAAAGRSTLACFPAHSYLLYRTDSRLRDKCLKIVEQTKNPEDADKICNLSGTAILNSKNGPL